jgi:hypothetical protein
MYSRRQALIYRRVLLYIVVTLAVGACGSGLPQVTPTVAPTSTPTEETTDVAEVPTDIPIINLTDTPTLSPQPSATHTATPTHTPSPTNTGTRTPSPTPTNTDTPTLTYTPAPTDTPTPTHTATATQTDTPAPTNTSTITPQPTPTPTPTDDVEIQSVPLIPTIPPTWTPVAQASATNTIIPPTLDVTPTQVTATIGPVIGAPTLDPTLAPTAIAVTPNLSIVQPQEPTAFVVTPNLSIVEPTEPNANTAPQAIAPNLFINRIGGSAYLYNVGIGQIFNFNGLQLSGGVVLFAPNPVDQSSFSRTDPNGILRYKPIGSDTEESMPFAPFFDGFAVDGAENNKNRVVEIDWSADGQQLAFRIDTPAGLDDMNEGVWFWQPAMNLQTDPTYQVIRDCAASGNRSCGTVNPSNANLWQTTNVEWSPVQGDNNILLTVNLPEENRSALAVVQAVRDGNYAQNAPEFVRYDYGHWLPDGQRILVSGRRADGRVIIGYVNSQLQNEQVIFDATAAGLWVQNAVQRPNGQIVALGRVGDAYNGGAFALYDSTGNALSDPIGVTPPEDVRWYPDKSAVVVSMQGRQYTVRVDDGSISDTTDLTANPSFGIGGAETDPLPQGVLDGSEYPAGQRLQVIVGYLRIRQEPTTGSLMRGGLVLGDTANLIAGPYDNEGYRWWKVQTASDIIGWIAGTIDGSPTITAG